MIREGDNMRVGIDARGAIWYRGTGIGTYTYQLIYHLKKRADKNNYRPFWPGEEYVNLDITNNEEFSKIETNNEYWEECFLPQALVQEKIDVYHVPQNGIGLPRTKKCRQVVTVHDLIPYIYPETVGKGYLKTFLTEMPRIMEQSDRIITVSRWSKRDIEKIFGYPSERIDVISEAPEPIYQPLDRSMCRGFLAENYQIKEDYILYVGGFSPRKNIKVLITAFSKIKDEVKKPIYLVLPGRRQKEQDYIDALISALNIDAQVIFPGFVPVHHLPYFYNAARVFVYPSYYEGFGLPPLEAMACGTPTLAARASSLPEVVEDKALLFDPYDPLELAQSLFDLLSDPERAKKLGRKGLRHAAKFSWEKTAAETVGVYEKLFGN
ncbi:MAG: glycosyltransferase family 4 protein [Bacillota bacterium]|jgi:glycosyltransferase involved in cell wall biosynthesis|nr:glycosyltransferase family 4 protein [Clostridia bacterium]